QTHVALDHIQQLRQFVQQVLADENTSAGDARVIALRPLRRLFSLRVNAHAAKLDDAEFATIATDSRLDEKHWAVKAVIEQNGQCCQQHDRRRDDQQNSRENQIKHPLYAILEQTLIKAIRIDQPIGCQQFGLDPAGLALVKRQGITDMDAVDAAIHQLRGRKIASALIHDDHDFVNMLLADNARQGTLGFT